VEYDTDISMDVYWERLGMTGLPRDLPPVIDEIRDSIFRKLRPYLISGLVLGAMAVTGLLGLAGWSWWSLKKVCQPESAS
jgi:hypothetical protein